MLCEPRSTSLHQHGFLPRRSCPSNLQVFPEMVTRMMDEGHTVVSIDLDFAKAFESVNHKFVSRKRSLSVLHISDFTHHPHWPKAHLPISLLPWPQTHLHFFHLQLSSLYNNQHPALYMWFLQLLCCPTFFHIQVIIKKNVGVFNTQLSEEYIWSNIGK